jgi:DNA-directed RNA polymerase specialized sigma24 family protein
MLDGSRESLSYFVDRHLGPLSHYLERRLGRYADEGREVANSVAEVSSEAGDIVQQIVQATFRDAFHHLRPYAIGIARTPMRMWLIRRAERYVRKLGRSQATDAAHHPAERGSLEWLRQALHDMPRRQEMALSLALFEKLTPAEIGHAMGVRPARAMRFLRGALLRINKRILAGEELGE